MQSCDDKEVPCPGLYLDIEISFVLLNSGHVATNHEPKVRQEPRLSIGTVRADVGLYQRLLSYCIAIPVDYASDSHDSKASPRPVADCDPCSIGLEAVAAEKAASKQSQYEAFPTGRLTQLNDCSSGLSAVQPYSDEYLY